MRTTDIAAIFGSCGSLNYCEKPGVCSVDMIGDPDKLDAQISGAGSTETVKRSPTEQMRDDMSGTEDFRDDLPTDDDTPRQIGKSTPVHVRNESGFSLRGPSGEGDAGFGLIPPTSRSPRSGW